MVLDVELVVLLLVLVLVDVGLVVLALVLVVLDVDSARSGVLQVVIFGRRQCHLIHGIGRGVRGGAG